MDGEANGEIAGDADAEGQEIRVSIKSAEPDIDAKSQTPCDVKMARKQERVVLNLCVHKSGTPRKILSLHLGYKILDLRNLVAPPSHHPLHRQPSKNNPYSRTHDRNN